MANNATVKVTRDGSGDTRCTLSVNGNETEHVLTAHRDAGSAAPPPRLPLRNQSWGKVAASFVASLPATLTNPLREWSSDAASDKRLLLIEDTSTTAPSLPWELLPEGLTAPRVRVARLTSSPAEVRPPRPGSDTVFLLDALGPMRKSLPSVARELARLHGLFEENKIRVVRLTDPELDQFRSALTSCVAGKLHLVSAHRSSASTGVEIRFGAHWITLDDLTTVIGPAVAPDLVVLNGCDGDAVATALASRWSATVVAWSDFVFDEDAADFALFFYQRLLEGLAPTDATAAYVRDMVKREKPYTSGVPSVWLPSAAHVDRPAFAKKPPPPVYTPDSPRDKTALYPSSRPLLPLRRGGDEAQIAGLISNALEVSLEVVPVPYLCPALLQNGLPALERLTLHVSSAVRGLRLTVCCDAGSGTSTVRQMLDVDNPGIQPDLARELHFTVLDALIARGVDRRHVNFTVTVLFDDRVLAEVTRVAVLLRADEWLDSDKTWPYVPAFVTPHDDRVGDVITEAQRALTTLRGKVTSFCGYDDNDSEVVDFQVQAIFQTLRDHYAIRWTTPRGGPLSVGSATAALAPSDAASVPQGQYVRFPAELIDRKQGTCHDLSLLFAACLERVGIRALVVLLRGHTLFGYWRSPTAAQLFWTLQGTGRTRDFWSSWVTRAGDDLFRCVEDKTLYLVEATSVSELVVDFNEARNLAYDRTKDHLARKTFDAAIDVWAARRYIQPVPRGRAL